MANRQAMTEADRQKLCERLRTKGTGVYEAADEIERLAEEVKNLLRDKSIALDMWHHETERRKRMEGLLPEKRTTQ